MDSQQHEAEPSELSTELVDKEIMRNKFITFMTKRVVSHNSTELSRERYLRLIDELKTAKTATKKVPRQYWLLRHYDILVVNGEEQLIVPMKEPNSNIIFYCCSDVLFDVLYDTHVSINHGGRDKMIKVLSKHFKNITRNNVQTFLAVCESCKVSRLNEMTHPEPTCRMDFIDFRSSPDGNYKYILVYRDYKNKFVALRPLEARNVKAVVVQLSSIFSVHEPPSILLTGNCRQFCMKLDKIFKNMCPTLSISHCYTPKGANKDLENVLKTWMINNNNNNWSTILEYVQSLISVEFKREQETESVSDPHTDHQSNQLPVTKSGRWMCCVCAMECTMSFKCFECKQSLHNSCASVNLNFKLCPPCTRIKNINPDNKMKIFAKRTKVTHTEPLVEVTDDVPIEDPRYFL